MAMFPELMWLYLTSKTGIMGAFYWEIHGQLKENNNMRLGCPEMVVYHKIANLMEL